MHIVGMSANPLGPDQRFFKVWVPDKVTGHPQGTDKWIGSHCTAEHTGRRPSTPEERAGQNRTLRYFQLDDQEKVHVKRER